MDLPGRAVLAARRDDKALPLLVCHPDAKACQQLQRDVDIGLGDQLAHHLNHHVVRARYQRQRHQQRREELAGHIAAHLDGGVQCQRRQALGVGNAQGWVARLAQVVDAAAELAQGIDQVANRALVHTCHARQLKLPAQQRQGGGERAHGGACIAQKKLRGAAWRLSTQARNTHALCADGLDCAAQLAQGIEHDVRVVTGQQVVDVGSSFAQCRQQQYAVGNAFGAR